jgi:anhydro-N-acetylmuramic acid kinase
VRQYCRTPDAAYICGGGARNTMLMRLFTQQGMARHITTTDALGLPAEHVEATAFAWLAWRTLRGQPGNLPAVTGAVSPRILGAIYLA